jgi:translocation and assembly module TamA
MIRARAARSAGSIRASLRLKTSDAAAGPQEIFDARYDIPFGDLAREKMSLDFNANDTQVTDTVRTSGLTLTPSITQVLGRWQRVLAVAVARSITNETSVGRQVDNLIVPGVTYASVPEGYLGEALLSRTLLIDFKGSQQVLGAKASFLRVDVQSEKRFNLTPAWHLLLRAEVGGTKTQDITLVPGTYRFFAGGDRSVRGFAANELSPLREVSAATATSAAQFERVGGRDLLVGSVEVQRDLPKRLALAAFTDFGNAVDRFTDPLAYSVGIGLRWRLPGLTLGLDIAKAVHAPGFDSLPGPRLHLNISQTL